MIDKDKIIASFESLGLSNYEARAYLASLNHPPLTGYKLSKLSGVPRSRIYETIEKLTAKGLVVCQTGDKTLLTPLDFKTFLDKKEEENQGNIGYLRETLPALSTRQDTGIWNITGREQIMKATREIIRDAEKHVYLELFADDLLEIEESVLNIQKKDIPIWGVFCGKSKLDLENFYPHLGGSCSDYHEIAVCVDGEQSLIGCTQPPDTATAAFTQNKGFIYITEQYIKHEIFINRLFASQDKDTIKMYIGKYEKIMNQLP